MKLPIEVYEKREFIQVFGLVDIKWANHVSSHEVFLLFSKINVWVLSFSVNKQNIIKNTIIQI